MSHKRKHPDDPNLLQFDFDDIVCDLRQQGLGGYDLAAAVIWDIAHRTGLTLRELKKHKPTAPAFSNASWEDVASKFSLDASIGPRQLPIFSVPMASLPPSFHREVMKASNKWLDVYQERDAHNREAARVRLMDAWHVPVCSLFKGRLVDKPEASMHDTFETSGGEVEHEVYMIEGIILLVFELKLQFKNEQDHVAQVLLELASAYKVNSGREFRPQPPVYAILTDLRMFSFFCYDGSQFSRTTPLFFLEESRSDFLAGMRRVSEHLFSILLQGYIGTLGAIEARSCRRGIAGDVSQHSSAQAKKARPEDLQVPRTRPSLSKWSKARAKALEAQNILVGSKGELLQSWEEVGSRGLLCLVESVSFLPKIGSLNYWDGIELDNEIENVLLAALQEP